MQASLLVGGNGPLLPFKLARGAAVLCVEAVIGGWRCILITRIAAMRTK